MKVIKGRSPALRAIVLVAACIAFASATAQSARAQAPQPLAPEDFIAMRVADGNVGTIKTTANCGNPFGKSTIKYTATGPAMGNYPGTYWETGTVTIGPGLGLRPLVAFKAEFTIESLFGRVTGTKQLDTSNGNGGFSEGNCQVVAGIRSNRFDAPLTYTADIRTASGMCRTAGEANASLIETDAPLLPDDDSAEFLEFFNTGSPPVCAPPSCPPSHDGDGDGLIDSRESLLRTLLGNPDSDRDGIKDGNDDANGNGDDDEDEDDDDGCPDKDSDGDGEDDEDEDDDEDDDD